MKREQCFSHNYDSDDLIKRAIVASAMPVPFVYRCKYPGSCNTRNTYFNKDWLIPYSDRMKGKLWRTTYKTEEKCGESMWFLLAIIFITFLIV